MGYLMYVVAIAILVGVLKLLALPIKLIGKFVINSIIGGVILYFLVKVGIFVVIAWWSVLLAGILGVPGVIIAVIISMFF